MKKRRVVKTLLGCGCLTGIIALGALVETYLVLKPSKSMRQMPVNRKAGVVKDVGEVTYAVGTPLAYLDYYKKPKDAPKAPLYMTIPVEIENDSNKELQNVYVENIELFHNNASIGTVVGRIRPGPDREIVQSLKVPRGEIVRFDVEIYQATPLEKGDGLIRAEFRLNGHSSELETLETMLFEAH